MNLPAFIISSAVLLLVLRKSYDIWFRPDKFTARINNQRDLGAVILGFSLTRSRNVNLRLLRILSIVMIIGLMIAVVFSVVGPIRY